MRDGSDVIWIDRLSESELRDIMRRNPHLSDNVEKLGNVDDWRAIDNIGRQGFNAQIGGGILGHKRWDLFKNEFYLLVCTDDRKYKALRRDLSASATKSQTAGTSMIAAVMANQFGVAGILVPFCALCLIAVVRLGREAFCMGVRRK